MKKTRPAMTILSVLLCALMILGIFSGCGDNGDNPGSSGTSTPEVSTPESSDVSNDDNGEKGPLYIEGSEGVTLSYWVPMTDRATQEFATLAEHPYYIWLKEQTGVDIEFIHPTYEQQDQQLNLMIASGEYYDMLFAPWYPGGPQIGIDEGCFIDLRPYMDEYLPDYKKALECGDGSFADWEWGAEKEIYDPKPQPSFLRSCTTSSGAIWTVSQIWSNAYYPELGPVIRKDWLDEAGLDVPETLEELEVVLEAFKQRGEDVIPMTLDNQGTNVSDGAIISAFDVFGSFVFSENRTEIQPHGYTQDAFEEYLTLIHDWYSKGYIDSDFMNRDDDSRMALFLSDRLGVIFSTWGAMPDDLNNNYTGDQDFEAVAMPLPRKTKDQQLHWVQAYDSSPTNNTCITTSCEHPEIAAAWLNTGFTKEGMLRRIYGVEGDTYEMRDGVPYYTDKVYAMDADEQDAFFNCFLYPSATVTGYDSWRHYMIRYEASSVEKLSQQAEAGLIWGQNASPDTNWGYVVFSDDGWGQYESAWNDGETYANPMVLKFIIGEEPLSKFEEFRTKSKEMGLDRAQQVAQEALDVMNGK